MPDDTLSRGKIQTAVARTLGKIQIDKDALRRYSDIKKEFESKMFFYLDRFQTGKFSVSQLRDGWTAVLKDFYPVAYKNGLDVGMAQFSYGKWDKIFVSQATSQELVYLNKFVEDIRLGAGVMPYEQRLGLYISGLDNMQGQGLMEAWPDQVSITWRLGETEMHCEDCLDFAANSPYTKASLPAVPRDGTSRCLGNCDCSLEVEISERPVRSPREPLDRQTVKLDRDLEKNVKQYFQREIPEGLSLPDDQQRIVLDSLFSDIYKIKGQLAVETDPILKRELILRRQALNGEAIDYAAKNKIYYVRSWETVPTSGIKEVPVTVAPKIIPPIPTGVMLPATNEPFPGTEEKK